MTEPCKRGQIPGVCVCVGIEGGGEGGGRGHLLYKHGCADKRGLIFRVCLERGGGGGVEVFHCKKKLGSDSDIPVWKRFHICLEGDGKLPYTGVLPPMICSMSKNCPINKEKVHFF